jgi:signal peptidase I
MPKFKLKNKTKQYSENSKTKKGFDEKIFSIKKKLEWLDPFSYVDKYVMPKVKSRTESEIVEKLVNLFFAALFAGIIYFVIGILFGSATPLVIVYSESMEPVFYRGDIMALSSGNNGSVLAPEITLSRNIKGVPVFDYAVPKYENGSVKSIVFENGEEIFIQTNGSIIVYPSYPFGIPIIHRAIVKIHANDGTFFLTKGDNVKTNLTYDQDCGQIFLNNPEKPCITFFAVTEESIQGKAFFKIPVLGCLKLWLVDDLGSILTTGNLPTNFNGFC